MEVLQNLRVDLPYDPALLLQESTSKSAYHGHTCTSMQYPQCRVFSPLFLAAPFEEVSFVWEFIILWSFMLLYFFAFWCADLREQYLLQRIDVETALDMWLVSVDCVVWCVTSQECWHRRTDSQLPWFDCTKCQQVSASGLLPWPFSGGHYRAGDLPAPMLGNKRCADTSFNLLMRSVEWRDVFSARTHGTRVKATCAGWWP